MKLHPFGGLFIASLLLLLVLFACDPDEADDSSGSGGGGGSSGAPTITSGTYDGKTGVLIISGTNLPTQVSDWNFTKLRIISWRTSAYGAALFPHSDGSASDATTGKSISTTAFQITFKGRHRSNIDSFLNKAGTMFTDRSGVNISYNLGAIAGAFKNSPTTTDLGHNTLTVSNPAPFMGGAFGVLGTYDVNTGTLKFSGSKNLPTSADGYDLSKFLIRGQGDRNSKDGYPPEASGTVFTTTNEDGLVLTFSGSVKMEVEKKWNKDGYRSSGDFSHGLQIKAGGFTDFPATTGYVSVKRFDKNNR